MDFVAGTKYSQAAERDRTCAVLRSGDGCESICRVPLAFSLGGALPVPLGTPSRLLELPETMVQSLAGLGVSPARLGQYSHRGGRDAACGPVEPGRIRRPYRQSRMALSQSMISLASLPSSLRYFPRSFISSAVICRMTYTVRIFLQCEILLFMPSLFPLRSSG